MKYIVNVYKLKKIKYLNILIFLLQGELPFLATQGTSSLEVEWLFSLKAA